MTIADRPTEGGGAQAAVGKRIGGRLCLDFVNSVRARLPGGPDRSGREWMEHVAGDRIDSYEALVRWGAAAEAIGDADAPGLLRGAADRPERAKAVFTRALALREALYRIFKATIEGWPVPPRELATLNDEVRTARAHEVIVAEDGPRWEWAAEPGALDRVLWPIALDAAALLTGPELRRVGQCPGAECGWLFLDRSRSGRRRWCDMADCGNLAKVRRHRGRKQRGAARR